MKWWGKVEYPEENVTLLDENMFTKRNGVSDVYYMAVPVGHLSYLYHPVVNTDYKRDEEYSLASRFSFYNTTTRDDVDTRVRRTMLKLNAYLGHLEPWTQSRVLAHYNGSLRRRYERAAEELRTEPLDIRRASKISCFVKKEKWEIEKPPRTIMSRDPKFTLCLSKFTKPFEHRLFKMKDRFGLPIFAKGRNVIERHDIIKAKFELFNNTKVVGIDCTKFDAHVTTTQLRWEHGVYLKCFQNNPRLRALLKAQEVNVIRTKHGIKIVSKGKRMSGDANTGLGNCVIVYLIVTTWIEENGLWDKVAIFCDGDDTLIFLEPETYPMLDALVALFNGAGHEMRIDKETSIFEEILFCQSNPIGGRMVRNWRKVVSHAFVSHKHYGEPKFGRVVMKSISQAELALNSNIPILGAFFSAMLHHFHDTPIQDDVLEYRFRSLLPKHWRTVTFEQPTPETREQFYMAYDITPEQQIAIEQELVSLVASADYQAYNDKVCLPIMDVTELNR